MYRYTILALHQLHLPFLLTTSTSHPITVMFDDGPCTRNHSWVLFPPREGIEKPTLHRFIHQVIIITGLNKLQLYVLALKMALDADRA